MVMMDRYILWDLLRLMLLTTLILVTVIAFGAAIRPLAEDQLLTAPQVAKYIALATVPMMQFALPFAAGFASTVLFHRLTSDNEVLALSTSGVSYWRILRAVVVMGVAITLFMVGLTQWAVPRIWTVMHRTMTADITDVFQVSVKRGEPFQIGDLQIYAEDLVVQQHPADVNADTRLRLFQVAAAELDEDGKIVTDVTAGQATIDIYRREGRTLLTLALADTVAYNSSNGQLIQTEEIRPDRPIVIPDAITDDTSTMSHLQLLRLRASPDEFGKVRRAREDLAATLRDQLVFSFLDEQLEDRGEVELRQLGPEQRVYVVRAEGVRWQRFVPAEGGTVEVVELLGDRPIRLYRAPEVTFQRLSSKTLSNPVFDLELSDCEVSDVGSGGSPNQRARLAIPSLVVPETEDRDLTHLSSRELLAMASEVGADDQPIEKRIDRLETALHRLDLEIAGRLNHRYALCVTAPLLLLLGATLAMLLRGSLPLTVYLWAFLPSLLNLILITSGDQMFRTDRAGGLIVLWSGNAAVACLLGIAYLRLARH